MTPSPADAGWLVETPRPADRGLVARLLEQVVAADPSVAPEVADGSQRPGPWVQRVRPTWSGIVVDPGAGARTVVGYAAVVADPEAGHRLQDVLVAPGFADRGVEAVLLASAAEALAELEGTPLPEPEGLGVEVGAVTYPDVRVARPRRRAAIIGAALIAALGAVGVLAVQVGVGPVGDFLPFVSPGRVGSADDGSADDATTGTAGPSPQAVVPAGQPLQPLPTAGPTGPTSGPTGGPTAGPTGGPTTPGSPTPPPTDPPAAPGVASSLLDPVVSTVVDTVDGLTGGALSPATGPVETTADGLTDTLDELPPPTGD